ncbi:DUF3626 domain-containing protein [Paenibacillus melissococcoides]|uniref:DUF3626 domain-containing protein n=1 Tax=Paenibacillus melissococcoides TaxID=2912268 RepID=A0ABN8TZP0_9BACL|nr:MULTISPECIES: DUF3626 domain-containing protein [Paenibacillus]GIO82674.1 hypothetical protein J6TS7_62840 [Paenibacillus dendritiformis]CAH8244257.1 DUF3626 domain-containing protein [Paenibacillus melissococcoides]CAH8703563.1 DUF3626 domain-containing protein [Paenibacillus melissococcoides]CAH8705994.1 DUF3626 domain-containing protein [Paenibacillus melissococcoides]
MPGQLDANAIGKAARSLARHPELWADWGTPGETWQLLKQLWHVLARFGHPYRGDGGHSLTASQYVIYNRLEE